MPPGAKRQGNTRGSEPVTARRAADILRRMVDAVSSYAAVEALHVIAVLAAYGLPLAYPLLLPYVRGRHPRAMPALHDVQHRLNIWLTGPGTVLILAFGAYLASRSHRWGEPWVDVPLAIIAVIAVAGGWIVRATGRMSELSRQDVERAAGSGVVAWSPAYERLYRRYMAVEVLLGALVVVAIFFMAARPFD